jgi:hypothetical protein
VLKQSVGWVGKSGNKREEGLELEVGKWIGELGDLLRGSFHFEAGKGQTSATNCQSTDLCECFLNHLSQ